MDTPVRIASPTATPGHNRAANYDEITHHKDDAVSIFHSLDAAATILVWTLDLGTAVLVMAIGSWLDRR